ncbi:hypothetical protein BJY52DRAFT_1377815, partial [Lactarius psammicola]
MYTTRAMKFDDENVKNWEGGADAILVFLTSPYAFQTGIFSSTVATFINMSYPNLQQDPNVITRSVLERISQQLPNATTNPTPSSSTQTSFSPSASVVIVNSIWFLSLVLSLTCALAATLLKEWTRRYRQIIRRDYAPHVHAHVREYLIRGTRESGIIGLFETLPLLLHISVFLFFAGLVVFAFIANHVVAYITAAIVGFSAVSYIALTLVPFITRDCPFSLFSVLYRGAKEMHDRWGTVNGSMVNSFRCRYE